MKIGFIGLGKLGSAMLTNLLRQQLSVVVFDVNGERVARAVASGATAASSEGEVAARSDVVVTMLPSPKEVERAYVSSQGIFSGATRHTAMVDCSTVSPGLSRELCRRAEERGLRMADAPASGDARSAKRGMLTFMVGADLALFDEIMPTLSLMGRVLCHCGGPGRGQVVKVCNSMMLAGSMVATSEAMIAALIQGFFTEYLVAQRAVSPRTVACYRDALTLLVDFASHNTA